MMEKSGRRGRGRSTIEDVARLAGVSPMTVSRVTNDGQHVRESTRARVLAAIAELNYAPNMAARSLASAEGLRIALLYSNPSASWLSALLVGTLDQATRIGAQVLIERHLPEEDGLHRAVTRATKDGLDGVILPAPLGDSAEALALFAEAGIAAVSISSGYTAAKRRVLTVDNHAAALAMTRHLIALGHRDIGFVIGHPDQTESAERTRGFREAMDEAGLPIEAAWVFQGYFDYRSGLDAGLAMLGGARRPTAIFASNDDMAAGVCAAAHRHGLDLPDDLSVAGFDDIELAGAIWPALSTVRQPIAEMGRVAIEMIAEAVRGDVAAGTGTTRLLPFELVLRDSVAPPLDKTGALLSAR